MWVSSRPPTGVRVNGQPIELVDEFCYLAFMLKNNGSYKCGIQQSQLSSPTKPAASLFIRNSHHHDERKQLGHFFATCRLGYSTMKIFMQKSMWRPGNHLVQRYLMFNGFKLKEDTWMETGVLD
ncbi:hypothetical protein RB195_024160 [Necator americanus]|uniref:Uncharacterized protein n=1 Tax=Necator americanus TaxID=51031 RepID=A0ABR1EM91_NECAM